MATNHIKITDTTFRDAHQSLLATRLRTADLEPIAAEMDSVGFHSMEVWGGATFDVATRFLAEDPWERLRTFKKLIPNTPLMMLLRGQSLVGYRNYADDVVDAFVQHAAEGGIDIFRVFDALNDEGNIRRAAEAINRTGKHLQLAICYSVTEEGRLGGPIYNLEYFVERARLFQDMGADSICLKDMGGLMSPYDAFDLVTALKPMLNVPLQLHTHYTSGMASMTALKAIEAGIDAVDTCLAPLALRTSQPAIEPLVLALRGHDRDTGLDMEKLLSLADYLESMLPKYREQMEGPRVAVIDPRVISHQIPGGMASNLISQLRQGGALDRLDEVLDEIPRTRKELGYPPLVTPMSQMVGSQSVSNVLFGRYKMISDELKDYVYGLYGRAPAPMDPWVVETALKDYRRGQDPTPNRSAERIEPEMEPARDAISEISTDTDDVLTYALYPTTGLKFIRIKHGLEPAPDEMKSEPSGPVEDGRVGTTSAGEPPPPRSPRARSFNVYVGDEFYRVNVDPVQSSPRVATDAGSTPATASVRIETASRPTPQAGAHVAGAIVAPMPGILLRYDVEVGRKVQAGDPIVVLEAMKMENTLPSPVNGTVTSLPLESGTAVSKDEILAVITPDE